MLKSYWKLSFWEWHNDGSQSTGLPNVFSSSGIEESKGYLKLMTGVLKARIAYFQTFEDQNL